MENIILIDGNNGRLGNQLFPLMVGISYYCHNSEKFQAPIYFKDEGWRINSEFRNSLDLEKLNEIINFDLETFLEKFSEKQKSLIVLTTKTNFSREINNQSVIIQGYLQEYRLIDEHCCQEYLRPNQQTINKITNKFKNIRESVCLHVRRGDFLREENQTRYVVLTKKYIEEVILKYFPEKEIICISDDICWCKENLKSDNYEITFSEGLNTPEEFWLQTLTYGNICSASSFSIAGAMLNPNLNAVTPKPYYLSKDWERSIGKLIVPEWMKRYPIT